MTDQNNVIPLSEKQLAKPLTALQQNLAKAQEAIKPALIAETVATLASCLALVRPVGMAQADADEWLRVAAREVAHLPSELLTYGCAQARKTCTHHGQIIPSIIKTVGEWYEALQGRLRMAENAVRREQPQPKADVVEIEWKPTLNELDQIKADVAKAMKAT